MFIRLATGLPQPEFQPIHSSHPCDATQLLFRGFKLTGPTVIMIYRMAAADLLRFVVIYFIYVMGFAQGIL